MMNDQECTQVYNRLAGILEEKGLSWVTAQVAEQIRIGKTIQKEIETLREGKESFLHRLVEDDPSRLRKGQKATFPITVEYQPSEQLELLIDAVKQTIVNTADMEHELIGFIEKDDKSPKKIEFYSDDLNTEPKLINRGTIGARLDSTKRLQSLLENLRKEISK